MLSKKEQLVMQYIYEVSVQKKNSCILSPLDIAHAVQPKYDLKEIEINEIINGLVLDNYISVVYSDKNGKTVYCINLKQKGEAFERELKNKKKTWGMLITRTVILAIISFVIGLILKTIFHT